MFPCSGERHVELAIHAVIGERDERGERAQAVGAQRDEDHVAGAALVALHGIDGQFVGVDLLEFQLGADAGDLCAVGRDDADAGRAVGGGVEAAESAYEIGDEAGLVAVGFVRGAPFVGGGGQEQHAAAGDNALQAGMRGLVVETQFGDLPQEAGRVFGQNVEGVVVEEAVGKVHYLAVHAALPAELGVGPMQVLVNTPLVEALKERVAQVIQSNGLQGGVFHCGRIRRLAHHGGQLLVIADEDKSFEFGQQPGKHGF